jgi:2-(3-amino-3-carboxypropyl)histidine synthase
VLNFTIRVRREIVKARDGVRYGLILGTLGRQGNISLYGRLKNLLKKHNKKYVQFLMAEINPSKLLLMSQIDVSSCMIVL